MRLLLQDGRVGDGSECARAMVRDRGEHGRPDEEAPEDEEEEAAAKGKAGLGESTEQRARSAHVRTISHRCPTGEWRPARVVEWLARTGG